MRSVAGGAILLLLVLGLLGVSGQRTSGVSRQPTNPLKNPEVTSREPLDLPLVDPRIVVSKSERQLELFAKDKLVRIYHIGLGFNPVDDKTKEGDGCTPEGEFYIFTRNAKSAYYLSLGISYPNAEDAARGLRDRLITKATHDAIVQAIRNQKMPPQYTALGGLIYIHGNGASKDWTWGCVALENEDMRELFAAVSVGTPVVIKA